MTEIPVTGLLKFFVSSKQFNCYSKNLLETEHFFKLQFFIAPFILLEEYVLLSVDNTRLISRSSPS
jgi:hypothetical protein